MKSKLPKIHEDACPTCGTLMRRTLGPLNLPVNGEEITVPDIDHRRCPKCNESITDVDNTRKLFRDSIEIYRQKHDLLTSEEIKLLRLRNRLAAPDLAQLLHAEPQSVERWEEGREVQTPAYDIILRLMRDVPGAVALVRQRAA